MSEEPKIVNNRFRSACALALTTVLLISNLRVFYRPVVVRPDWRLFSFVFLPPIALDILNIAAYGWWLYAVGSMVRELKRNDERMLAAMLLGRIVLFPLNAISLAVVLVLRYVHLGTIVCAFLAAASLLLHNWTRNRGIGQADELSPQNANDQKTND